MEDYNVLMNRTSCLSLTPVHSPVELALFFWFCITVGDCVYFKNGVGRSDLPLVTQKIYLRYLKEQRFTVADKDANLSRSWWEIDYLETRKLSQGPFSINS